MHVGEAKIAPLETMGQPGVVDAQKMEGGGVEIVDVDGIVDDVVLRVPVNGTFQK